MSLLGVPSLSLALFGCSGIFVALAVHAYRQPESVASRRWFIALMAAETGWTGIYGIQLAIPDRAAHFAAQAAMETTAVTVPVIALFFFLRFAGEDGVIRPATVAAGGLLPLAAAVSFATNPTTGLAYRRYELNHVGGVTTLTGELGPGLLLVQALSLVVVGVSAVVLFWTIYRYRSLYRQHVPWLVVLYLVTVGAFVVYRTGNAPLPGLRLIPFTAPLQGIVYGNLIFRYDLAGVSSRARRIGRRAAMQSLEDGLVIVDEERRIIDYNDVAERALDGPPELLGRPAGELLGAERFEALLGGDTRELAGDGRTFEATATAIRDQHGDVVGHVVLLRDVTERKRREQRLAVLNRVLRHNVRNETTVMRGNAELIAAQFDGEAAELAAEIEAAADELVALGEKARRLESVLGEDRRPERVDVPALAREVADGVAEAYPEVSFAVEGEAAAIVTRPAILESALRAAIENAAEHNDAPEPAVVVAVRPDGDGVAITVEDNGPGIPEGEIAALEAGAETPLEHASGLGVWLIQWGVEYLGGDVAFERAGERGTAVTLSIPDGARAAAGGEGGVEAA